MDAELRHPGRHARTYHVRRSPSRRQGDGDVLSLARPAFPVHGLIELDVAEVTGRLKVEDPPVSWTAYVVASLARAAALHPEVNVRRAGRRVVAFDADADGTGIGVSVTVPRQNDGRDVPVAVTINDADHKSCFVIFEELDRAKHGTRRQPRPNGALVRLDVLPTPIRRAGVRLAGFVPSVAAAFGPVIGVRALDMFAPDGGWAIPLAPLTVIASVGKVVQRPVAGDGQSQTRPMLPVTLSFDHEAIDSTPAARFVASFRNIAERALALEQPGTDPPTRV